MMSNPAVLNSEELPLSPGQRSPRSPLEVIEECDCKCSPSKALTPSEASILKKASPLATVNKDVASATSCIDKLAQPKLMPCPNETASDVPSRGTVTQDCKDYANQPVAHASAPTSSSEVAFVDSSVEELKAAIPRKSRVTFSKVVQFKEIRHIKDYSPSEVAMIWNTPNDYQLIKAVVKRTVSAMMKGIVISEEDGELSTRGLEFRTKAGSRIRSRNKLRARSAVLNEQDMQRDEGFSDPHFIAMAAMEESLESRQSARARGLYDEEMSKVYMADIRAQFPKVQ